MEENDTHNQKEEEPCNCGMNYCDENGCVERKRILVEPIDPIVKEEQKALTLEECRNIIKSDYLSTSNLRFSLWDDLPSGTRVELYDAVCRLYAQSRVDAMQREQYYAIKEAIQVMEHYNTGEDFPLVSSLRRLREIIKAAQ